MGYGAFHLYVTSLDLLQVCNDQSSLASDSCFSSLGEMHWSTQSSPSCWRGIHRAAWKTPLNCSCHDIGAKEKVLYYPFICQSWILIKILYWFQQNEENLPHFCNRPFGNYCIFLTGQRKNISRILCCWETFEEHYIIMHIFPRCVWLWDRVFCTGL